MAVLEDEISRWLKRGGVLGAMDTSGHRLLGVIAT
jgi:hypothetical protein